LHVDPDGNGMCVAVLIEITPLCCPEWQVEHAAVVPAWLYVAPRNVTKLV
jgi:hypothetical protein